MKILTSLLTLGLITASSLSAQTTMCFKENHTSMATIESIALDGGECSSNKSVQDMKNDGWSVEDIKIEKTTNGSNYIYIFKKDENNSSSLDQDALEQRILKKLEERKKAEIQIKKQETLQRMSKSGKKLYIEKCQSCHGEKADEIYGTSRALDALDLSEFQLTMRDYILGEYDRGQAMIMRPYATAIDSRDIKNIYSYIQSLKKPEVEKKEEESK
ncbi:c-type cytochrome [Campylobacterota bacterium DY0563]